MGGGTNRKQFLGITGASMGLLGEYERVGSGRESDRKVVEGGMSICLKEVL